MKITYIHHSSFSVELENCILLFDYFEGKLPRFDKNKKLYVFSSHSHNDHFSKIIFDLEKEYPNTTYILSDDIKNTLSKNTVFVKPNQSLSVDNLEIKTLKSNDLGVAFIVKAEDEDEAYEKVKEELFNEYESFAVSKKDFNQILKDDNPDLVEID